MNSMLKRGFILAIVGIISLSAGRAADHTFVIKGSDFLLDGRPYQIMAGELHFQRIPREYWRDRLDKARAMGLNTVATYVYWGLLEPEPGQWDFSGENDIAAFIREARAAGLWVLLRPGPYACAEWDFGGLPPWLLRIPDIKIRCGDARYLAACESYVRRLAAEVRDLQVQRGGPVLMLQIENEYGSFGNDREYLLALKRAWEKAGIAVPFFTADGAAPDMLEAGTIPGAAIGLDPGTNAQHFAEAEKLGRGVPVFCSEIYPGWITHWGEPWARVKTEDLLPQLAWLLENGKSFNLYLYHGGTNFGFTAGANFGEKYLPTVTSYDYDSPLNEMGQPTPKYFALRDLLAKRQPGGAKLPELPAPLPVIEIPELLPAESASIFDQLPGPRRVPQPRPMEAFDQNWGFILYRTNLVGARSGKLTVTELHDYANIYVDGKLLGTLDRSKDEQSIEIPATDPPASRLEILVEAHGPDQLRRPDDRPQGHHRQGDARPDDPHELGGLSPADGHEVPGRVEVRGGPPAGPAGCLLPRPVRARGDGRYLPRHERLAQGGCLGQRPEPRPLLGRRAAEKALLSGAVPEKRD